MPSTGSRDAGEFRSPTDEPGKAVKVFPASDSSTGNPDNATVYVREGGGVSGTGEIRGPVTAGGVVPVP